MLYTDLKYPTGNYLKPMTFDRKEVEQWINEIFMFPEKLILMVDDLPSNRLDKTYRPDSWTVRQLVHHCADSHMNAFIRFKWTLTEVNPTIKPYFEAKWAEMDDYKGEISPSIQILKGVHRRWCRLMKAMSKADWQKIYFHPDSALSYKLYEVAALYAWHGLHHLAHMDIALHEE